MTHEQMQHIWVEVLQGRDHHGDFLKSFAAAYSRADMGNMEILSEASSQLIGKFGLGSYLDNFEASI